MDQRKLSDIIIEIAKQGLLCEKYAHSKVMHALMALAHIAWNWETVSESYTPREQYIGFINQLRLSAKKHPQGISFRGLGGHHKPHESIQKATFPKRSQSHYCLWVHGDGNPPSTMARWGTTNASTRELARLSQFAPKNSYF